MSADISLRAMTIRDIDACLALMQNPKTEELPTWIGMELWRLLSRNPTICWIAQEDAHVIGAVFCGHDGWRGYLYHLEIAASCPRANVASSLLRKVKEQLASLNIHKMHVQIEQEDAARSLFWLDQQWEKREDIMVFCTELPRRVKRWVS